MSALADILEVWGFEQGKVVFSDGSLGFGLTLTPIDVSTWDDSRIDKLAEGIGSFLNGLPSGIDLQFVQDIMPAGESLLNEAEKLAVHSIESTARTLHTLRLDTLRSDIKSGCLPAQTLRLFVRKPMPTGTFKKSWLFPKTKAFNPIAEETLYRELATLGHLEAGLTASLKNLLIKAIPVGEREMAELIYRQWNPLRTERLESYDADDVRSALLFSDISVYEKGFSIGGMHHRIVSLKLMPTKRKENMQITKHILILMPLSLALNSCATMEESIFAGAGITGAFGTAVGGAATGDAGGALIGLGLGAVLGGTLGYLGHKEQEEKNKLPKSTSVKKEEPKTPSLTSPEVRRVWVPEKIEGDRFIDGHYMYLIERNSVWSK